MHTCGMTRTYLRSGLSAYSVLLVLLHCFFLRFIKNFDATEHKFLLQAFKNMVHTFVLVCRFASVAFFVGAAMLRLSTTVSFGINLTIFNVSTSNFSDLTFKIANPTAKPQDSHPVGFIFYFFQLLQFCALHWQYCFALALGQDVY